MLYMCMCYIQLILICPCVCVISSWYWSVHGPIHTARIWEPSVGWSLPIWLWWHRVSYQTHLHIGGIFIHIFLIIRTSVTADSTTNRDNPLYESQVRLYSVSDSQTFLQWHDTMIDIDVTIAPWALKIHRKLFRLLALYNCVFHIARTM